MRVWLSLASQDPAGGSAAVDSPVPRVAPTTRDDGPRASGARAIPDTGDLPRRVLRPPAATDVDGARRVPPDAREVRPAEPLALQPNQQGARRDPFTNLIGSKPTGAGLVVFAALVAATLGAFHALEPGHGKTVVAAYLVGSPGTGRPSMLLGLIVTASHTAGGDPLGGGAPVP